MAEYYQVHYGNQYNVVYGNYYPPAGGGPTFTSDATSGKPVPQNSTEWSSFLSSIGSAIPVPGHLWLMQETSGTLADSIGASALTVSNSAYNKSISGWSRKAMGGSGAIVGTLRNLAMADTALNSFLVFMFARYDTSASALRAILQYGSPTVQTPAVTQKVRLREGANLLDSTNAHDATIHPFLLAYNQTNSTMKMYTDLEKLSVTFSASVGNFLTFTTSAAADTSSSDFIYAACWEGGISETTDAEAKKLITGFGFTPPWS